MMGSGHPRWVRAMSRAPSTEHCSAPEASPAPLTYPRASERWASFSPSWMGSPGPCRWAVVGITQVWLAPESGSFLPAHCSAQGVGSGARLLSRLLTLPSGLPGAGYSASPCLSFLSPQCCERVPGTKSGVSCVWPWVSDLTCLCLSLL